MTCSRFVGLLVNLINLFVQFENRHALMLSYIKKLRYAMKSRNRILCQLSALTFFTFTSFRTKRLSFWFGNYWFPISKIGSGLLLWFGYSSQGACLCLVIWCLVSRDSRSSNWRGFSVLFVFGALSTLVTFACLA
jgi:accessory gene regulator protein AgrB